MYRRRRVLAATGTALAGLLAGCDSGSTNTTNGGGGGGGGGSRSRQRVTIEVEERGEEFPNIGRAVDIDGTTAVTGSRDAVVLDYSDGNWETSARLLAETDDEASNRFGYDVAVSGDTVLIGAEGAAATVFQRDGGSWGRVTKLPSEGVADDPTHLGKSVALDGDTAAVRGDAGTLVFRREGGSWTQETTLSGSGGDRTSLALAGSTLIVGYPDATDDDRSDVGRVRVFRRDGEWSEVTQLVPDDASADLRFGQSVGFGGGTLVAGAFSDDPEKNTGSAYVFAEDGGWSQQTTLAAPKTAYNGFFGSSAAVAGDTLLVGGSRLKRAYLYGRSDGSWSQTQEFSPGDEESRFGADVAVTSDWAVVGDPFGLNEENFEPGAVYFVPV